MGKNLGVVSIYDDMSCLKVLLHNIVDSKYPRMNRQKQCLTNEAIKVKWQMEWSREQCDADEPES